MAAGCDALLAVVGNGIPAAALEYLDAGTLRHAGAAFPGTLPRDARFLVIAEADGTEAEARRICDELADVFSDGAFSIATPPAAELWRWRDGVSLAVAGARGGKVSEDIVVPVDRLAEAVEATIEIGARTVSKR